MKERLINLQVDFSNKKLSRELNIDLFKDTTILGNLSRSLGKLRSNKPNPEDLDRISEILKGENILHLPTIQKLCSIDREYKSLLDIEFQDSHYLIERFGLSKSSKNLIITYDFSNFLDLVFSIIANSKPSYVRCMTDYDVVSKSLLNLDFNNFNIPLRKFSNLDENLSEYLAKLFYTSDESFAFSSLLSSIMTTVVNVVGYVGLFLQSNYDCSLRSMNGPIGVLTGYSKLPFDDLIINYKGCKFKIPLLQECKEEIV